MGKTIAIMHNLLVKRPCQGGSYVAHLNFKMSCVGVYKCLSLIVGSAVTVVIWLRGSLSLVAISFYVLSLLFGPCRLLEFTLAGRQ